MDRLGVDGAILVSPLALYRFDARYSVKVQRAYPGRFAVIKPVDPHDPAVAETIAEWKKVQGAVAIRLFLTRDIGYQADHVGIATIMREARRHDLPVNVLFWGNLEEGAELISRFPDVQFVVDHLALLQPERRPAPPGSWEELPKVLALAARPNAVIKVSGACTLSLTAYPFADIWGPLARVFDAWGLDRCIWGSDWTRAAEVVGYQDAIDAFRLSTRLSASERDLLMGGACARVYKWRPGGTV